MFRLWRSKLDTELKVVITLVIAWISSIFIVVSFDITDKRVVESYNPTRQTAWVEYGDRYLKYVDGVLFIRSAENRGEDFELVKEFNIYGSKIKTELKLKK